MNSPKPIVERLRAYAARGIAIVSAPTLNEAADHITSLETDNARMREALRGLLKFAEEAEVKLLVGDEGCLWPVEFARAALSPRGESWPQ